MPHGNDCTPGRLAAKLRKFKQSAIFQKRPRPILINEDSTYIENLEASVEEGCSWGFFCQGYGSDFPSWSTKPREDRLEDLSGYQTLPVNWGINTERKRAFFEKVAEITGCLTEAC